MKQWHMHRTLTCNVDLVVLSDKQKDDVTNNRTALWDGPHSSSYIIDNMKGK